MMPLMLEDFGALPPVPAAPDVQTQHLDSFDAGYRAGWDDAIAAETAHEAEVRAAIARNLQALAFTYHDARTHVLRALAPLISDLASRLLPEIARAALPQLVAEALAPYAELAADAPLELSLHPSVRPEVEALVGADSGLPLTYREDPALAPGQIWLAMGESETRIDIDAALATIRTALDDFFTLATKESRHG